MSRKYSILLLVLILTGLCLCPVAHAQQAGNGKATQSKALDQALIKAIRKGDVDAAARLLKQGANVNALATPGQLIIIGGDSISTESVPAFLGAIFVGMMDIKENSNRARQIAAKKSAAMVKVLIANSGNAWKVNSKAALEYAAYYRYDDIIRVFLANGMAVNTILPDGATLFSAAAGAPNMADEEDTPLPTDMLAFLLKKGAKINAQDKEGKTALMHAVENGNLTNIRFLLDNGADVNIKDKEHETALTLAMSNGRDPVAAILRRAMDHNENAGQRQDLVKAVAQGDVAKLNALLKAGGDANARDDKGDTLLMKAAEKGTIDLIKLLLENKADIDARSLEDQYTALYKAAENGHTEAVNLLLDQHADMTPYTDAGSFSAFTTAILNDHLDVVQAFIAHGADINAKNKLKATPLMEAANYGRSASVKLLLEHGADVNAIDDFKMTALQMAQRNDDHTEGFKETILLLVEHGATPNKKK